MQLSAMLVRASSPNDPHLENITPLRDRNTSTRGEVDCVQIPAFVEDLKDALICSSGVSVRGRSKRNHSPLILVPDKSSTCR